MTEKCQRCNSDRLLYLSSKSNDLNNIEMPSIKYQHDGYLPYISNICSGDYTDIKICLNCGQLQGDWPVVFESDA